MTLLDWGVHECDRGRDVITSYHHCRIKGLFPAILIFLINNFNMEGNSVAASSSSLKMAWCISLISSRNVSMEVREVKVSSVLEFSGRWWENRAEDVALSLDAIKRCLLNMLTALDRDTPQTKNEPATHNLTLQELTTIQEPPCLWLWAPVM